MFREAANKKAEETPGHSRHAGEGPQDSLEGRKAPPRSGMQQNPFPGQGPTPVSGYTSRHTGAAHLHQGPERNPHRGLLGQFVEP